MATKNKRSLEDVEPLDNIYNYMLGNPLNKNYKYILDDDGKWHRIGADDMTRTFEQLVVTPKGNKYNYVPKSIDNSEQGARYRDKMLSRQYTKGYIKGEPGLELTHPELDVILLSPLAKAGINTLKDTYGFVVRPNSFTRGIGSIQGLNDLVESGLVRGNPIGTEVGPKQFRKLYNSNRDYFRDIMNATNRKGIAQRYYSRTLTEEDFNAIKEAAKPYIEQFNSAPKPKGILARAQTYRGDIDPLSSYKDFIDYQSKLAKDRITLNHATSYDDSGQPLAYFYDDGRNPITKGYDYAASEYGVRINNASDYNPRIFEGHKHYSMPEAVPLTDPNVEVFRRGPFGITIKMNKNKLIRNYGKQK